MLGGSPHTRQRRRRWLSLGLVTGLCVVSVNAVACDAAADGAGCEPLGNLALASVHGLGSETGTAQAAGGSAGVILWDEIWSNGAKLGSRNDTNQGIGNAQSVSLTFSGR